MSSTSIGRCFETGRPAVPTWDIIPVGSFCPLRGAHGELYLDCLNEHKDILLNVSRDISPDYLQCRKDNGNVEREPQSNGIW